MKISNIRLKIMSVVILILAALIIDRPLAEAQIELVNWTHLSSATGDLPVPPVNQGQSGLRVVDLDKNGQNDYVITLWDAAETVVWYRHLGNTFEKYIVDTETPYLSHGEKFKDIDGDGDIDLLFADASPGNDIYWWENPYPNYERNTPWVRRIVRDASENFYHDNIWGDFDGDGSDEIIAWNQYGFQLLLFEIPADPKNSSPWPVAQIFSWTGSPFKYRGTDAVDINLDGKVDLVGGGGWFEHTGGTNFIFYPIDDAMSYSQIKAGQIIPGGRPEVVCVLELRDAPLNMYEWTGSEWQKHSILGNVPRSHTLQLGDVNLDGSLDIMTGELGQWSPTHEPPDNPDAKISILYGDGFGNFIQQVVFEGQGDLEGQLADIDNDGDLDIVAKPFRHNIPRVDIYINQGNTPTIVVPNVVGLSQAQAEADIIAAGLGMGKITSVYSDTVLPGDVINQKPPSGFMSIMGAPVDLLVSSGMGAYQEDFDSYSSGEDPLDWLDTGANNSLVEEESLFKVFDLSGEKAFGTTSPQTNVHSHYNGMSIYSNLGYEFTGRMMITDPTGGIGITFLSQYPTSDAYYRLRRFGSNSFHISPHGTEVSGEIDTRVLPLPNQWYRFRIQVEDSGDRTEIRARVWLDGEREPLFWAVNAYDDTPTRLTFGTIGVWSHEAGSKYWDDLIVGSLVNTPEMVVVPDVTGLSQSEAEAAIVTSGLNVGATTTANSDTVPAGDVISQDPIAGISVSIGSEVDLVVSLETAAYQQDFEVYAAGDDPVDWFDTGANNSLVEDDSLFKVFDLSGDKVFGTASPLANIHSHYSTSFDALTGFEYTGRMRMTAADGGIGVTFLSDYPNSDTYYRLRRYSTNSFHISPHGTSVAGDVETNVTPLPNTWYAFKIQVEDTGSRIEIRAKVWAEGSGEPSDWQVDCYDATPARLTAGPIGMWSMGSGEKYWDDLIFVSMTPLFQYSVSVDVDPVGSGSVILDPAGGIYDEGTVVELTATAAAGWEFNRWSGDLTDTVNPVTLTVDGDKSITASFVLNTTSPVIVTQPVDQTVSEGQTASFSVTATGSGSLSYQWQRDGVNISGATDLSYTILAVTLADDGAGFRCVVTNALGSITSDEALLTVLEPSARVTDGQVVLYGFQEGSGLTVADVSLVAPALDLTIQDAGAVSWLADGGLTVNSPTLISSVGAATKVIDAVKASGEISVEAWIVPANSTQDGPARIVSLSQDGTNRNFTLGQGQWGSLPPEVFDMRLRTTATSLNGTPSLTTPVGSVTAALTQVVYTRDATGQARLYVDGLQQVSGMVSGDVSNWDSGYALGLGNEIGGGRPWLGDYHLVAIFDRALSAADVQQNFDAGLDLTPSPPTIVIQPVDQTVSEGQTASFSVTATGSGSLSYQWQRDGANISGATDLSYTILAVTLADDGAGFRCVVTNALGSITSDEALLTVLEPSARVTDGQVVLYGFQEGSGLTVADVSLVAPALDLTIQDAGAVSWLADGGLTVNSPTLISSVGAATKVIDAVKASGEISVEAWIVPANSTQDGPARIVSLSQDGTNRNFTLGQGQWGSLPPAVFDMRLRTTATSLNGTPSLTTPVGSVTAALTQVVYTRDATGQARLYVDGLQQVSGMVSGDVSNWDSGYALGLGNEIGGGRPWLGDYHLVAIFDRALSAADVQQNFDARPFLGSF